VRTFGVVER